MNGEKSTTRAVAAGVRECKRTRCAKNANATFTSRDPESFRRDPAQSTMELPLHNVCLLMQLIGSAAMIMTTMRQADTAPSQADTGSEALPLIKPCYLISAL